MGSSELDEEEKRVILYINGEYSWMQKNEERENLMVTVLKSMITHIHGVLNLGH